MSEPRLSTLIADSERVYLDTTVFINLGEAGALLPFVKYLGDRARIVHEVDVELRRNSTRPQFGFLRTLSQIRGWPPAPPVELTPPQMLEVLDVRRAHHDPGEHRLKHLGEIASVVAARADDDAPVVSDDGLAARMCALRGIERLTTADVVLEMAASGHLDIETAREAFDTCTAHSHRPRDFDGELEAMVAALG